MSLYTYSAEGGAEIRTRLDVTKMNESEYELITNRHGEVFSFHNITKSKMGTHRSIIQPLYIAFGITGRERREAGFDALDAFTDAWLPADRIDRGKGVATEQEQNQTGICIPHGVLGKRDSRPQERWL